MSAMGQGGDPPQFLDRVIAIAEDAGRRIMEIHAAGYAVHAKEDQSPLTAADLAAHAAIVAGLTEIAADLPILSEESSGIPYSQRRTWSRYWLVDPLDGTKEFIAGSREFTVNIALIENHEPVLGVVLAPALQWCFAAARGHGAFKREAHGPAISMHTRKTAPGRFVAAGSRSHGSEIQDRFFKALGPETEVLSMGSALKFCLVAEGRVDIYPRFGPTSEWDTAAAQCVVQEAGGLVTDLHLAPLRYNTRESFLNPHFLVIADPAFDWRLYLKELA